MFSKLFGGGKNNPKAGTASPAEAIGKYVHLIMPSIWKRNFSSLKSMKLIINFNETPKLCIHLTKASRGGDHVVQEARLSGKEGGRRDGSDSTEWH